ncbi:MAG TPA: HAMP domain-containing sensor histidine kinase, partial [Anaerolineales bacterium]|nr:HAMP domain-containing sensor histidine kinase [Anaerolineales bacterium]
MGWFKQLFRSNPDARELFQSTSRNLIQTILGIGVVWHFIATLGWPETFSPSLWLITIGLVVISILSLKLLQEYYLAAQLLWFGGLFGLILYAYVLYQRPEIIILLIFLPLIVIVTVGLTGASIGVGMIILLSIGMARLEVLPALPAGFGVALILGSIFSAFFGWGLASNLLDAIGSASYHYRQARKLLEETRQHRAQISRMLKDQHQTNYQLERLNQMLFHARGRAETARHERDRFILAVSHELRSPLNFVIGFSDLMVNSPATYGPVEDWPPGLYADIQEVYRSSNHLLGLINDILDLGQIDAQEMALFPERVKFQTVVKDVVEMAARPFAQKGLWIKTEFEPDLPEVYVDCTRLRQVLLNLLNNSLRFTSQGGAWVRLKQVDQQLLVEVEDSGAGIEPDDLPRVFDEFRQVGQDNWRRREGSGLGLSISRRFVRLHGGEMGVESEVGRGTRFYFTLPISGLGQLAPEPLQSLSSRRPY